MWLDDEFEEAYIVASVLMDDVAQHHVEEHKDSECKNLVELNLPL